ncbi:MAG: CBS domain-containing protein, partial [Methanosarcinales archaeon]
MTKVKDFCKLTHHEPLIVREYTPLNEVVDAIIKNPTKRLVYVLDSEDKLVGVIRFCDILKMYDARMGEIDISDHAKILDALRLIEAKVAKDLMKSPISVTMEDDFVKALNLMVKYH